MKEKGARVFKMFNFVSSNGSFSENIQFNRKPFGGVIYHILESLNSKFELKKKIGQKYISNLAILSDPEGPCR